MKRAGNLWPQLTSWENLLVSAMAAAKGKRKRPDVARFLFDLEPNVCALRRELLAGAWKPGEYRTFWIHDPKPRMISAAPFRDRVVGLPIGNQTSQFFANVYLNALDHFVLRQLRPALYLRYVDDFVIFGDDKADLAWMRRAIVARLADLRLELNEGKSRVYRCADGVTFLVWRLFPGRARLPRRNVVRMRRRLRYVAEKFHRGEMDLAGVRRRVSAWLGHAAFGSTWKFRSKLFAGFILIRAERSRCARGFLEQQYQERPGVEP